VQCKDYRALAADPIGNDPTYKAIVDEVNRILDKEIYSTKVRIHPYASWSKKKKLLKEKGIDWLSPKDLNPSVMFD
jgi:hypothetical protein